MNFKIDINSIVTAVLTALIIWGGARLYMLDSEMHDMRYQAIQINIVLQDLYERQDSIRKPSFRRLIKMEAPVDVNDSDSAFDY